MPQRASLLAFLIHRKRSFRKNSPDTTIRRLQTPCYSSPRSCGSRQPNVKPVFYGRTGIQAGMNTQFSCMPPFRFIIPYSIMAAVFCQEAFRQSRQFLCVAYNSQSLHSKSPLTAAFLTSPSTFRKAQNLGFAPLSSSLFRNALYIGKEKPRHQGEMPGFHSVNGDCIPVRMLNNYLPM